MSVDLIIRPGIGLGDLTFGASRDRVRTHLGEPEAIEGTDVEPIGWITWAYPTIGVDASFDEAYAFRLTALVTENKDATLFGYRFIGLDSKTALEKTIQCPLGPYRRAEDALGWEAEFDEADLEFRFDNDRLWLISWRVLIDENDLVHWPK